MKPGFAFIAEVLLLNWSFRVALEGRPRNLDMMDKDPGFAAVAAPRNDDGANHRMLATPTASSDSSRSVHMICTETIGCVRHCSIFSENDSVSSKKQGA